MKQRGRKSALSVVGNSEITADERPQPLPELTNEQKRVWVQMVEAMPAEWFPGETHGLLGQYCRHKVACDHIAELIRRMEQEDEIDAKEYDSLLKMQERESRILLSTMTKMRVTQQSTYHPEKVKGKGRAIKSPWET